MLKAGNERFRTGKMKGHDYLAQKRASAVGQYPAAAILSCIDSRAPAEIILDTGIGKPAVPTTTFTGERTSKNETFVDAVATTNVRRTVQEIRARSTVLGGLEKDAKIKIVPSMYYLVGGRVEFLSET